MQNGDILKELRKGKKVKQKDIAELLKTTRQYYSEYECEKRELPLRHLETLADYFGVSTDYILGRKREEEPQQEKDKK